jgi:kinesin family protein 11
MAETSSKGTNVQVAVRMRPLNQEERKSGQPSVVTIDNDTKAVKLSYGPTGKKMFKNFNFDKVFGSYSRQEDIFNSVVSPIVDEVLEGFNCTIFAYGQTGTGKTHTMEGDIHSEENAGIVPRSIKSILEKLDAKGVEYTVRVSFLELYNEELQDLLTTSVDKDKKLKLCEDVKKGVVCQNLEEIAVMDVPTIFEVLQRGIKQRQTAATLCNKNSSRSHSIFTMKLMIKEYNIDGEEVVRHGQMNLVDLAGSECVGRSGATGERGREAGSINQSLLTLGRVINALVDHHGHVPYRDSKLTRLLQESLGGKAKTCIIATFSPVQSAVEETMSTLDYAYRARAIKNQPCANQKLTTKVVMKEYFAEIESLKHQLALSRDKNGVYVEPAQFAAMETRLQSQEDQLIECESALKGRTEEVKVLKVEKEELTLTLETTASELQSTVVSLEKAATQLEVAIEQLDETKVDLKATEAVVAEQVVTECSLLETGNDMQEDLTARQNDLDQLLRKVSQMAQKEAQSITGASAFVSQLSSSSADLISKVEEFQGQSSSQAEALCSGVATMLTKGRATCSTLTTSIDQVLESLIGDADTARDSMVQSCEKLKGHLQSTNGNLESTLRSLQEQLSTWLGEADVNLKEAQSHLQDQKVKAQEMVASINQHSDALTVLNKSFVASQHELKQQASRMAIDLKKELTHTLTAYGDTAQSKAEEASKILKAKAADMEKAMQIMLKDLVESGSKVNDVALGDMKAMQTNTLQQLTAGTNSFSALSSAMYDSCVDQSGKLSASNDSAQSCYIAAMGQMTSARDATNSTISGISATVGQKRKHLDDTISTVVEDVGQAIEHGCKETDATAATAKKMAIDVSSATSKMSSSAKQSMEEFSGFMDQEGETIKKELGTHFQLSEKLLNGQSMGLAEVVDSARNYDQAVAGARLQTTGSTPSKAPQRKKRVLQTTRDHAVICSEVFVEMGREGAVQELAAMRRESAVPPVEDSQEVAPSALAPTASRNSLDDVDDAAAEAAKEADMDLYSLTNTSQDSAGSEACNASKGAKGGKPKKSKSCENSNPNTAADGISTRTTRGKATASSKLQAPLAQRSTSSSA